MEIKYPFSRKGVKWFLDDSINDIFSDDFAHAEDCDIFVTINNRQLRIPLAPESYEALECMLNDFVDIWETDYI